MACRTAIPRCTVLGHRSVSNMKTQRLGGPAVNVDKSVSYGCQSSLILKAESTLFNRCEVGVASIPSQGGAVWFNAGEEQESSEGSRLEPWDRAKKGDDSLAMSVDAMYKPCGASGQGPHPTAKQACLCLLWTMPGFGTSGCTKLRGNLRKATTHSWSPTP